MMNQIGIGEFDFEHDVHEMLPKLSQDDILSSLVNPSFDRGKTDGPACVLWCVVLCCVVLRCVVMCCDVLCCVVLCCVVLCSVVLCCVVLCCVVVC
jgi:hypothetical protein